MWQYLFQVTLCLGILYIPYVLLFQRETFFGFNRWYLLASAAVSVVLPLLPRWLIVEESVPFVMPAIESVQISAAILATDAASVALDWKQLFLVGYLVVATVLLLRLAKDLLVIFGMFRTGERSSLEYGNLVVHADVTSPFSFFNTVYISPELASDEKARAHILGHELQHVRGRHSLDVLMIEVLCALLWLSPAVYIYRRALRNVHEFLADHIVRSEERIDYARLLVSQSYSGLQLSLTNQFFQSQLKTRIIMMMKEPSKANQRWKYLFAIPVLMLSIALFSFKGSADDQALATIPAMGQDSIPQQAQEIFKVVEEMPRFPGCETLVESERFNCSQKRLLEYIYTNIKYPAEARKNSIEGRSVAQFVVEKDGSISNVQIVRAIGGGCDEEVQRVVMSMNDMAEKWIPGRQRGKDVRVQFTLPVSFKLEGKTQSTASSDELQKEGTEKYTEEKLAREKQLKEGDGHREIFQVVEEMPRFPGCGDAGMSRNEAQSCSMTKLINYIGANLKYPAEARENKIEGREIVEFVVEPNGLISSIKSVSTLGYGCDREIIRLIESMNQLPERWTPGKQRGKVVPVKLTLPVQYKL